MRLLFAGIFVWVIISIIVLIVSGLVPADAPLWLGKVIGLILGFIMVAVSIAAYYLFNKRGTSLFAAYDKQQHLEQLEQKNLLVSTTYYAKRAFQVAEFEDEGSHYFIELTDNSVLYLSGQYLYEYEPVEDDPEMNCPRNFPCTEFTIRSHREKKYVEDINCRGKVLEPEIIAPHYTEEDFENDRIPNDCEIIRNLSYDVLKLQRVKVA